MKMKSKVMKLFSSTAISLVCIVGTMVLTANCGKDNDDSGKTASCSSGFSNIGKYSGDLACLISCSEVSSYGVKASWNRLSNGTCCCKK